MNGAADDSRWDCEAQLILSHIRGVLAALRISSTKQSYARTQGGAEPPFAKSLKDLNARLRTADDLKAFDRLALLEPFLEVVRCETTSALVTEAALGAVVALLQAKTIVAPDIPDCEEVLELVAEAATHCRFEGSADDGNEVVLCKILELLRCTLEHPVGARLEDETVYGMVQTCLRLALQPRFSALMRRTAEQAVVHMVCVVFGRHIAGARAEQQQEAANSGLAPGQELTDEQLLQAMLVQITDSERPEVEATVAGVVNTQRVQFSKESNTVKKMLESGLSVCCKLFKLMCSLLDRTRIANSDTSVLLGLGVIQAVLLQYGSELERVPGLVALVQDDLFHSLLHNLRTDNFLVLTSALSVTRNLFVFLTRHIKLHMELVINKVIEWLMADGVSYQKQEITLEFLVDLFRLPWFMVELYINYDCDPNCSDLFEKIAIFLYKNSYPPDGALYATHVLTLDGLLAIAQAIADRLHLRGGGTSGGAYVVAGGRGAPIDPVLVRRRKAMKRHLLQGAKDFNEKRKDERYAYLQSVGLLPTPLTPQAVARFFRTTPNVDKTLVGEVLGGLGEFEQAVLEAYLGTFRMGCDFLGVLRTFLESFKIPGEAQIIQRVLERFSHHFYEAHKHEGVFASEDAVFLLAYAMLILHVDNHSDKIVNKMREAQFKKTLRGTNGGQDFPDEMLSQIYFSVSTHEIKIYEDYFEGPITPVRWKGIQKRARRFSQYFSSSGDECDRDVFTLMWGRIIAAIGVVFNHSYNSEILAKATEGFKLCAEISAHFAMSDVFDNLIVTLCKYSHLLVARSGHNTRRSPVVAFAANEKAQTATALVFAFTRAHGNHLREGWRNIVDAVLNLHAAQLLQMPQLFALPEFLDPPQRVDMADPSPDAQLHSTGSGLFSLFGGGSWFGGGGDDSAPLPPLHDVSERARSHTPPPSLPPSSSPSAAAVPIRHSGRSNSSPAASAVGGEGPEMRVARECIVKCRIDEIVAGSARLQHDSLVYLVKALILGSVRSHAVDYAASSYEEAAPADEAAFSEGASQLCLDLLTQITLLNEHRILTIWLLVYEHMADIVAAELSPKALVQRTMGHLLLLCASFIRQTEITDRLIKCVGMLADAAQRRGSTLVAFKFGAAVLRMVALNPAAVLGTEAGWNTTVAALEYAARTPAAASNVLMAVKLMLHYSGADADALLEIERCATLHNVPVTALPRGAPVAEAMQLTARRWRQLLTVLESVAKSPSPADSGAASGGESVSSSALMEAIAALEVQYLCAAPVWEAAPDAALPSGVVVRSVGLGSPMPGSPISRPPPPPRPATDRFWHLGWQPVLSVFCDLCTHRQSSVRHASIGAVQRLLLSNTMRAATPELWRRCFKTVLLPLLEQLAASRKTAMDQQQLEATRIRAFAMVHKVFLIYLPLLRTLDDFSELWGSVLDVNERYLGLPGTELSDAVPESLKNVLLVLIDDHLLVDGNPLWCFSFQRIDRFAPTLRVELSSILAGAPAPAPAPDTTEK